MFSLAEFQYPNTVTSDHKAPIWQAYGHKSQSNFIAEFMQLPPRPLVVSSGESSKHISSNLARMPYDLKILIEFILIGKLVASAIRYLFRHLVVGVSKTLCCDYSLLRLGCAPGHSKHELLNYSFFR